MPSARLAALLLLALAVAGSRGPAAATPPAAPAPARPDVILVTIDTLRADRCSLHGAARPTTPFLDELARTSVVFDAAYSASSWTPPSMASIFTGLAPRTHGVVKGAVRDGKAVNQQVLDESFTTIAESFRAAGYHTIGVSSNAHVVKRTGFAQGFDAFRAPLWKGANEVNAVVRKLVAERPTGRPMFLWVHYFDPHTPYVPHAPWIDSYDVDFGWVERCAGVEQEALLAEAKTAGDPAAMKAALYGLYDSEIAYVDAALRRLFEALPASRGALVAITSDHGETIMNRGWIGHGNGLYDEETRVPLLIRLPGKASGRRVTRPVANADLYPTLLDAAGLPRPPGLERPGLLAGGAAEAPVLLELSRTETVEAAVRSGRHKLIRRYAPQPAIELYDLASDPQEQRDLAESEAALRARLSATLQSALDTAPARAADGQETVPADPELIERLRSLGYLEPGEKK
ncbi:MAG: sulfatase-like hydrolase/transferase [Acidobacteria bacterium]|jgi:arylsulfatase A-like enzyme|nr:sulfatase-like hydrolase/transferase [Acidobacteriota bacterium]